MNPNLNYDNYLSNCNREVPTEKEIRELVDITRDFPKALIEAVEFVEEF